MLGLLALDGPVTLGSLLSEPQLPHLSGGDNACTSAAAVKRKRALLSGTPYIAGTGTLFPTSPLNFICAAL